MGYRYYFHEVDKGLVQELTRCQSQKDVYEVYLNHGICKAVEPDEDGYYDFSFTALPEEVYEFGKYYENADKMYKLGKPLLTGEAAEAYQDYAPVYGGEELVLSAIDWQRNRIISLYEDLVNNNFADDFMKERYLSRGGDEKEIHYQRLLEHCKDHLRWWKPEFGDYTAYDDSKESEKLVSSWLYEHTIFDLVRIWKNFDLEKSYFVFLGH